MFIEFYAPISGSKAEDLVLLNLKKQAISLSVNRDTVYTFDLLGRLITAVCHGITCRRSLGNRVLEKWTIKSDGKRQHVRLWLDTEERKALVDQVQQTVRKLIAHLQQNQVEDLQSGQPVPQATKAALLEAIRKILYFDFRRLENDARRFSAIYRPVDILPPDMYLSVVLQATEGCPYNRCNYCSFYRDQPFRIKSQREFVQHIDRVKNYFGESIKLRPFIFLGQANALDLPQSTLLSFFDAIQRRFQFASELNAGEQISAERFRGVFSFLTPFPKNRKSEEEYAELKVRHLRRVYLGMESGCDALLRFLNKPSKVEHLIDEVNTIKRAGVNVGLIILLGAGGDKFYSSHLSDTVTAVREMSLDQGDIVFFSPLVPQPRTPYWQKAAERQIRQLDSEELGRQKSEMIGGFRFGSGRQTPKLADYDINEFIY